LEWGVIAPYSWQVERMKAELRKNHTLAQRLAEGALQVGTVDSFQGQERDLILFSCTRSNPRGNLGFVDDRQRLNVALSRARQKLIVLADGATIEARVPSRHAEEPAHEQENRRSLQALMNYTRRLGSAIRLGRDWSAALSTYT